MKERQRGGEWVVKAKTKRQVGSGRRQTAVAGGGGVGKHFIKCDLIFQLHSPLCHVITVAERQRRWRRGGGGGG